MSDDLLKTACVSSGNGKGSADGRLSIYYLAGLVSLVTLLVHLPNIYNDFVNWDDYIYVVENPHIRFLNWELFKWALRDTTSVVYWHPVTWISHAVDHAVWGLKPAGHHLTNDLLHAVNTALVIMLVIRLLEAADASRLAIPRPRFILIAAGVTGILFGIHPLHVESVVWVSERKDLLFFLFYVLSLMSYISYANCVSERSGHAGNKHYILSLVFFLLSLGSKPMAVSLPAVLLLLDWFPLQRIRSYKDVRGVFGEKTPFILGSILVSAVTFFAQRTIGAMELMEFVPLSSRVLVACSAIIAYLWKMLIPHNLLPLYSYPRDVSWMSWTYVSQAALVVAITAGSFFIRKKLPLVLAVWLYYLLTLAPVLGIIQVGSHSMADRFTYLPSLGPFLLVGLAFSAVWAKTELRSSRILLAKTVILTIVYASFLLLVLQTLTQISVWKNSLSLWNYVIERSPQNTFNAHISRGLTYQGLGQLDRAIDDFSEAIQEEPHLAAGYVNRGSAFSENGQLGRALEDLNTAIALKTTDYMAYNNRGVINKKMSRLDAAKEDFDAAITLNPEKSLAYNNRGVIRKTQGLLEQARADFDAAIMRDSFNRNALENRAALNVETGHLDRAAEDYHRACDLGSKEGCEAWHGIIDK